MQFSESQFYPNPRVKYYLRLLINGVFFSDHIMLITIMDPWNLPIHSQNGTEKAILLLFS